MLWFDPKTHFLFSYYDKVFFFFFFLCFVLFYFYTKAAFFFFFKIFCSMLQLFLFCFLVLLSCDSDGN